MEILKYPDPRLTAKNGPLGTWTPEASTKVGEMYTAMAKIGGVGLAAPQVGWNVRLFIMEISNRKTGEVELTVVFDPVVELIGEERRLVEGCLSFPGITARVVRRDRVRLTGQTPYGPIDEILDGLAAHAAQHEIDHLDGVLFIDRLVPEQRKLLEPYLEKLELDFRGRQGTINP